jgi:hypothetical protein
MGWYSEICPFSDGLLYISNQTFLMALKFNFSENATNKFELPSNVKTKWKITFVPFSEYLNFKA